MKAGWLSLVFVCLILAAGANAQFVQDPLDQGIPDTVRLEVVVTPDAVTNQLNVELDMYLFSDIQVVNSIALGFKWDNPNLQMTNAYWENTGFGFFDFIRFLFRNDNMDSTNAHLDFQCTGARSQGAGLIPGQAWHMCNYNFVLSSWTVLDEIIIDTAVVLGTTGQFVDEDGAEYTPYFVVPIIIRDANRPILSNIVLSEDTLHFSGTQGQPNPPAQAVGVSSDEDNFGFTVTETIPWLFSSPPSGFTPQDITVSLSTSALAAGSYFDSVRVDASETANSPQFVYVALELAPPPPLLNVIPSSLTFSAVAGGDDPPSQLLTIQNWGGVPLDWTVSSGAAWLTLNPLTGTDNETVTVSAVISGLGYGDYYDVITVSDPAATNSPVEIPVQLTVATDLPIIDAIYELNQFAIPFLGPLSSTQTFQIRNSGEGTLSYSLSWSHAPSAHIAAVSPVDGTAPETITVDFDFPYWGIGLVFWDTIWVHSSGALNTPLPVVFQQRVVQNPAVISVPLDPVVFTVYECSQGYGRQMPEAYILVQNTGGDNPMWVQVEYESEFFEVVNPNQLEFAPESIRVRALPVNLPTGLYYDTLYVTSPWAINKPQAVEIQYDFRPGDEAPEILTVPSLLTLAAQEGGGPTPYEDFRIYNVHGGCMDWTFASTPSWLTAGDVDGQVPDLSPLTIDATGFGIGPHSGLMSITSATAVNSPYEVPCTLNVWKLRGDTNWNGQITLQDVALLIDYVFESQHAPQPAVVVGDVNCDEAVDAADIVLILEYMFESGPPLCGNPY
jgi:hypothetical protein